MKSSASIIYNLFLVVGDFVALLAAFVGAYVLRGKLSSVPVAHPIHSTTYLEVFLVLLPFWILIFALLGLYNGSIYEKRFNEVGRLLIGSFIGLLFVIFWDFLSVKPIFPAKLVPIYGFLLAFIFLVIIRNFARFVRTMLFSYNKGITQILIVGNTKASDELAQSLKDSSESGYRILGIVGDMRRQYAAHYATFEDAIEALDGKQLHGVVQTELYADEQKNREILNYAQEHHISYRFIPGNTELFVGNIDVELFRSSIPVIAVRQTPLFGWGRVVKRLSDMLVALVALIVLSPFWIIIGFLIAIFDPGPIFFKQERITRFNGRFHIYKFRTMKRKYSGRNPEDVFRKMGREDLAQAYLNAGKIEKDPRISGIGKFLRRFSLDEIPQLLNVLKGDISLVGPRAVVAEELKFYEGKDSLLLSVKTGITGLAQVSGRSDLDYYERAKLDLYYVQNWTFWMDLVILIKTLRVIIDRSGAR